MGNNRSLTQAEFNTQMAKIAPQLYRPSTPDEVATAARPIKGMRFAVDQPVRDKRSGRTGKVDYCTAHTNGSRKYVITWDEGSEYGGRDKRTWVWEVDLREIERPESVIEAERIRANGQPPSRAGSSRTWGPRRTRRTTSLGPSSVSSRNRALPSSAVSSGAWLALPGSSSAATSFTRSASAGAAVRWRRS